MAATHKRPNEVSDDTLQRVLAFFNEFEVTVDADGVNPMNGRTLSDYIDVEGYVTQFLVDNAFLNSDSYGASSFYYFPEGSFCKKLKCGPVWDFDLIDRYGFSAMDTEFAGSGYLTDKMQEIPSVHEEIERQYKSVFEPYMKYHFASDVKNAADLIEASRCMNHARWQIDEIYGEHSDVLDVFLKNIDYRQQVIRERIIGEDPYHIVSFLDFNQVLYKKLYVKDGEMIGTLPQIASYAGLFNGWVREDNGLPLTEETRIYEDVVYRSSWLDIGLLLQNGIQISDIDVNAVNTEEMQRLVDEVKALKGEDTEVAEDILTDE